MVALSPSLTIAIYLVCLEPRAPRLMPTHEELQRKYDDAADVAARYIDILMDTEDNPNATPEDIEVIRVAYTKVRGKAVDALRAVYCHPVEGAR